MKHILALDQGTTSSRAMVFDHSGSVVALAQKEFRQIFPQPGWVEHDATEIWATQRHTATEALGKAGLTAADIAAIGITNQRETTVVWDRETGEPLHHAIVWQDRRTAARCDQLTARGLAPLIKRKTGLAVDAYFSGTKLEWLLRNVPGARIDPHRGHRGRPAGCAVWPGLYAAGNGEEHLWDRLFHADEHRYQTDRVQEQSPDDRGVAHREPDRIRARGQHFHRRGGGA